MKIRHLIALLYCLLIITSCCKEHDTLTGEVLESIAIDHLYEAPGGNCFNLPSQYCIQNDSVYQALFKLKSTGSCDALSLPSIDFSMYSVLLFWKEDGGRIYYNTDVQIDSVQKLVQFKISITEQCACPDKCLRKEYHIVKTRKIPADYTVLFQ